jgi:hypothetical protein
VTDDRDIERTSIVHHQNDESNDVCIKYRYYSLYFRPRGFEDSLAFKDTKSFIG